MRRFCYPLLGVTVLALCLFGPGGPRGGDAADSSLGGKFTLTDHTGQRVTNEDFQGKWVLVFFGFTFCPDICPASLMTMGHMMEGLGDDAQMVQPLFITVDPERDTQHHRVDRDTRGDQGRGHFLRCLFRESGGRRSA